MVLAGRITSALTSFDFAKAQRTRVVLWPCEERRGCGTMIVIDAKGLTTDAHRLTQMGIERMEWHIAVGRGGTVVGDKT